MEKAMKRFAPIFLLPTLIAFLIGFIVPFLLGLWLSFCEFTTVTDAKFVGFKNYVRAFEDSTTLHSLWFTALFAVVSLIFTNVLAFMLAYVLTKKLRGTNIFRTVFFMPNLIGGIVLGYIWQLIINGVLARFDAAINLSAKYGFWGLVVLVCWQQIGYMMIIYIAGLGTIPPELNEAASIDGASGKDRLVNVTLPMLRPSITICTFLSITNGFKLFDQNLSLTAGEPAHGTEMLALNIFNTFYSRSGFEGVGQAKAVMFFILVVAIGLIQLKFTSDKEVQA
jgi:raffinose/stachyose/melibiose transport system permease protein